MSATVVDAAGNTPRLIPAKTVAKMLDVNVRTIHRHKSAGKLPEPIRFGGSVRWREDDILRWIDGGCKQLAV